MVCHHLIVFRVAMTPKRTWGVRLIEKQDLPYIQHALQISKYCVEKWCLLRFLNNLGGVMHEKNK